MKKLLYSECIFLMSVLRVTDYGPQNNFPLPSQNATHVHKLERERNPHKLKSRKMRRA